MTKKYDVVIVGGGIGGLTAAAILSKKGKKVILIERNESLGGYLDTFQRNEFIFEASLHIMDSCDKKTQTYKIFKQSGVADKIKFLKPRYLYRSIFPGYSITVPQVDTIKWYFKKISQDFPAEKDGAKRLFEELDYVYDNLYDLRAVNMTNRISRYKEMLSRGNTPASSLINRFIKDYRLRAMLGQLWPYLGLPPDKVSSLYFSYLWVGLNRYGAFYPCGGSRTIVSAFQKSIIDHGGKIILNDNVKKIVVVNNMATGVVTEKNGVIEGRSVISNADALTTYTRLIGKNISNKFFIKRLRRMTPSISVFQCFFGLKDYKLPKDYSEDYQIFLNPSYDFTKTYYAALDNDVDKASLTLTLHSNLAKGSINSKRSVMSIYMPSNYDCWNAMSRNEYLDKKQQMCESMIARLKSLFPGINRFIQTKETLTPVSLNKRTGNSMGAIFGWAQTPGQAGLRRLPAKGAVNNLFLASAWTQPGGGVVGSMHSGRNAAEAIMNMGR